MITASGASLRVFPDIEAVSHEAAGIFVNASERSIASKGLFTVAVSGGSTPKRLFTILGSMPYAEKIDWSCVHFFWVDERCVPADHPESNFKGAFDTLLSKVAIPKENIHRIKGEESPEVAALAYERDLKSFFGNVNLPAFDLISLGMGEDGHTASLFPGSDSLKESKRLAIPVYVEKLKSWRVTLTLPVLNNGHCVIFLISGKNKTGVLKEILEKDRDKYPAGLIKPCKESLIWLLDEDAVGK